MEPQELLIKSAETIEAHEAEIAQLKKDLQAKTAECVTLSQSIQQTKTASDTASADAEAVKAKLAGFAKTAADETFKAGLLDSEERRDQFAAKLLDHETALKALSKVAAKVPTAPKHSTVVKRESATVETADDLWQRKLAEANQTLGVHK
jgi:hypothetical protein